MEAADGDYEEDPDFVHSDVDTASEEDDLLYERNVTDDIEIGSDMNAVRNEGVLVDVGELPSLLEGCL
ncbi:Hypothetical predicted protein [Olea europaea subsp. europaea]|uniref:Uncharacterized protein n=1 Tax=Olea europaea subsp. europaea TaxID=158383 RepID=A0A8S0V6S8_OLEEU|nr:Hypothetical predicted protein [Olea europaea subsp. europaea]